MTIIVNGSNTPTAGAVGYGDGTNLAFTSAGTTGQFLSSNGSSAPSWVGAPASAMTLISTQTANNTSAFLSWTGLSTYKFYVLILKTLVCSSTGNLLYLQFGEGVTPTWDTSSYAYSNMRNNPTASIVQYANSTSDSGLAIGIMNSTTNQDGITGWINIGDLTSSTSYKSTGGIITAVYAGTAYTYFHGGEYNGNSNVITAIRLNATGNIISGTASLYGISS